ncbi:hypothetical protein [Streptomyces sp. Ag109_G2-15]|uniref:hypothetical protein n=1 Tax=Streptomyces sp. Ag109_G2-15 TaxID=1938850 RepID=UPI000BC77F8B|nr:hypothetical protein [Streptomyces sp. Ag109_G2-15]SOE07569.1 hypothetical protein SAMN06272765_8469 [Streptomyces sp. Ag109_G2-15]
MTQAVPGPRQVVRVEGGFGYGVIGADLPVFPDRGPVYLLSEYRPPAASDDPSAGLRGAAVFTRGDHLAADRLAAYDATGTGL